MGSASSSKKSKKKNRKQFGDLSVQDDGKLGFSIFDEKGKYVCFFNKLAEKAIVKWIFEKEIKSKKVKKLRKKIGNQVYFDGLLWDVVMFFSPTKFDSYILVQRVKDKQVHEDSKTNPVDMKLIDCHNDEFYPNTDRVRKIFEEVENEKSKTDGHYEELKNIWLELF